MDANCCGLASMEDKAYVAHELLVGNMPEHEVVKLVVRNRLEQM